MVLHSQFLFLPDFGFHPCSLGMQNMARRSRLQFLPDCEDHHRRFHSLLLKENTNFAQNMAKVDFIELILVITTNDKKL